MARQARIVVPGVAHHITQRGNYRQDVFLTEEDYALYLELLRQSARRFGLDVSAYCLMTNHVHLIVVPHKEDSLAKALGRTNLVYAQHLHRREGWQGHLWQGRFYSNPMDDAHAWNAAAYVELNPVRAGMVEKAWDYPWSSAAAHCSRWAQSDLLSLDAWRETVTPAQWRKTLLAIAGDDDAQVTIRDACRTGHPLGDGKFLAHVKRFLGRELPRVGRGRPPGSKDKVERKPRT